MITASRESRSPVSGQPEKSKKKIPPPNEARVSILGPSGMLGSQIEKVMRARGNLVTTLGRRDANIFFDVSTNLDVLRDTRPDYVLNCIGVIPQKTPGYTDLDLNAALEVNAIFSQRLARWATNHEVRLIQIGTDCVFSGAQGDYIEDSPRDACDVYGISKILGESTSPFQMLIRSSVIGQERYGRSSLLEWVLGQPYGSRVPGFTDRLWNGVTTLAFAKVVSGVIESASFSAGTVHLVPLNRMTKFSLVQEICTASGRSDLTVNPVSSGVPKDMTLNTKFPELVAQLWRNGGYRSIPPIEFLIQECFEFHGKVGVWGRE